MSRLKRIQAAAAALDEAKRAVENCHNTAVALLKAGEPLERSWLISFLDYPSEFQRARRQVRQCLKRAAERVERVRESEINCNAIHFAASLRTLRDGCEKCPACNASWLEPNLFPCEAVGQLDGAILRIRVFDVSRALPR